MISTESETIEVQLLCPLSSTTLYAQDKAVFVDGFKLVKIILAYQTWGAFKLHCLLKTPL